MKKKLDFTIDVPTCTYVYHAAILGIVSTQFEKYAPWFYSHFIQIFTGTSCGPFGLFDMNFKNFPFIDYQCIQNKMLLDLGINPKEFIKKSLDEGWYVYTDIDEFFLSNKAAYQKYVFIHSNIIFGYDEQENTYDIAGYLQSKSGVKNFSKDKVSMNEVEMAFNNAPERETVLIKLNDFVPKFDYNLAVESLYDYVYSQNTSSRVRASEEFSKIKRTYGIKTMDLLKVRLQEIIETGYNERYQFDLRIFRVLWEHKKNMYNRFLYMNEKGIAKIDSDILREYNEVLKGYEVLFGLAKKVHIMKNTECMPRMIDKINDLIILEKNVLLQVLELLTLDEEIRSNLNLKTQ